MFLKQIDLNPDTGDTLMNLYSPQQGLLTRNRTPASNETGVSIDLVTGTVYAPDWCTIPTVSVHWIYKGVKQGAKKLERLGIIV